MEGGHWQSRAACRNEDPELFFPIGKTGPAVYQAEEAKRVCRRCEVRDKCLEWALEGGFEHGVWGGLDEEERKEMKRRNSRRTMKTRKALGSASIKQ